ncbi:MAG: excinuclease ABC subunit A, partial [Armatimonadetes bacterium]|nr:excinuclease ABC subunit A [Armatimonadota bacterium]
SGPREKVLRSRRSLTARYLTGDLSVPVPDRRRLDADGRRTDGEEASWLVLEGCREHNLRDLTVRLPVEALVCITGPSGSGKSTLLQDLLFPALLRRVHDADVPVGRLRALRGWEQFRSVSLLDQSPIGQSPRSNPATYIGVLARIREFFASLPEARVRGFTPGHFSFNKPGGRCEECAGMGARLVQMHFLPDVWVTCEECGGRRFKPEVLAVRYRGRNIADVLEMTIAEAAELFENFPRVARPLRLLGDMGLDYLPLGQAAPTLSGGEAQRMKIARELMQWTHGSVIYLLDEPTTGLHPADIVKLLRMLNRLVDEGNTVVVIEHNMDLVKNADWVIDLGPGGGDEGGRLVAEGPPEAVAQSADSPTAPFLRRALGTCERVPREDLTLPSTRSGR